MTDTSGVWGLLWSPKRAESALAEEIVDLILEALTVK